MDTAHQTGPIEVVRWFIHHQAAFSEYCQELVADQELANQALEESAVDLSARWREVETQDQFVTLAKMVMHARCLELLRHRMPPCVELSLAVSPYPGPTILTPPGGRRRGRRDRWR